MLVGKFVDGFVEITGFVEATPAPDALALDLDSSISIYDIMNLLCFYLEPFLEEFLCYSFYPPAPLLPPPSTVAPPFQLIDSGCSTYYFRVGTCTVEPVTLLLPVPVPVVQSFPYAIIILLF